MEGTCDKGEKCKFAHPPTSQNGAEEVGTSTVAISCVAQSYDTTCSSGSVAETPCIAVVTPETKDKDSDSDSDFNEVVKNIMQEQEKARVMREQLQAVLAVEESERAEAAREMLQELEVAKHTKGKKKKKRKKTKRRKKK